MRTFPNAAANFCEKSMSTDCCEFEHSSIVVRFVCLCCIACRTLKCLEFFFLQKSYPLAIECGKMCSMEGCCHVAR